MTQAINIVEVDCDFCGLTYSHTPCKAVLANAYNADFQNGQLNFWTPANATLVGGVDAATFTGTVNDSYMYSPSFPFGGVERWNGADFPIVTIEIMRTVASPSAGIQFFWVSENNGYGYVDVPLSHLTTVGIKGTLLLDMSKVPGWMTAIGIYNLRLDLDNAVPTAFKIFSIRVRSQKTTGLGTATITRDGYVAQFQNNALNGWIVNASATFVGGTDAALFTAIAVDPILVSPTLSINGALHRIIRIEFERTVLGVPEGMVYYSTAGHSHDFNFRKSFTVSNVVGGRQVARIDMGALDAGGSDWVTNTITSIRIDADAQQPGAFKLFSIIVGHDAQMPLAPPLGGTGTRKCFNTRSTCQDIANYQDVGATLRFAQDAEYLPRTLDLIPNIDEIKFTPGTVSLGENLGERSSLTVDFHDHRHPDTGGSFDKYPAERPYDPHKQGSFWPKFRKRHPYLQGRSLRLIRGHVPHTTVGEMQTRHYVIDQMNGPTAEGKVSIIAKDILKLADGDKAQAPFVNTGRLAADITAVATVLRAAPNDVGNLEYPASGFLNIGGKEIVAYNRLPDATLLLHADGTAATPVIDSASGKTITKGGNANHQVVAGDVKFGTGSFVWDGVDDSIYVATAVADQDFAFGTGDFTIALWYKPRTAGAANYQIFDFRFNLADIAPSLTQDGGNTITYAIGNSAKIVGAFTPAVQYFHIALTRKNGITKLWLNGNQIGASYAPGVVDILIVGSTNRPIFGLRSDSALDFSGWMDEIYIKKGRADWDAPFTPPTGPYGAILGDNFAITRAQMNTEAVTHTADERLQEVLQYSGADPADVIRDLLVTYAAVPSTYIPLDSWKTETLNFLGSAYTANIAEPTSVADLISEIIEQAALALWWDDKARLLRLQVLRAIPLSADKVGDDQRIINSLSVKEQPEKRISRVLVYFGQINPLLKLDQLENYRSSLLSIDTLSEADYGGTQSLKKIYSRWIQFGGRTIAERLCTILKARYRNAPRSIAYKLMKYNSDDPSLGAGFQLNAYCFQDDTGAREDLPVQITRMDVADAEISVEAEEMRFVTVVTTDHVIVIDTNINNLNLLTQHNQLYGVSHSGDIVTLVIQQGVIIGSTSVSVPALTIPAFPAGVTVKVTGLGRIEGKGGDGAKSNVTIYAPQPGGTALHCRHAGMQINMSSGAQIWGGGGGGGLGQNGGGGGGAGQTPGVGGEANYNGISPPGASGTTEAGGDGGATDAANFGGKGGGPGLAGASGTWFASGMAPGGAAGKAIDGLNYLSIVGVSPDIRGPQVNG